MPSSCIPKSWIPADRVKDTSATQPVATAPGFQSQTLNGPGSPFMKRGPRDLKSQASQESSKHIGSMLINLYMRLNCDYTYMLRSFTCLRMALRDDIGSI